jgi:DNA modification methylase
MAAAEKLDLSIALVAMDDLAHYERNARTHPQSQINEIKLSIRKFGFTNPILADLDDGGVIAAGHGRHMAVEQMLEAGETIKLPNGQALPAGYVPVIDCSGWDEVQRRAYTLADNKIAENSGWDDELLKIEIGELLELGADAAPVIGFSESDMRAFARAATGDEDGSEEATPEPPDNPVSKAGDIWLLGDHRIRCGDSTKPDDVEALLDGVKPHLMVTDPPYGVDYDPDWRNRAARNCSAMGNRAIGAGAVGVVQNDDKAGWVEAYRLFPGDVAYVWHPPGENQVIFFHDLASAGFDVRMQIIWAKSQLVIGRGNYHLQHEPCWYAVRRGKKGHWQGSRKESTLWEIPKPRKSETGHSTQKPVECMRRPIVNNSAEGDAIYEPFSGSGTTIIAGEMEARRVYAMELHPPYVDVAVRRWEDFTGKAAVLDGDGRSFSEISEERLSDG